MATFPSLWAARAAGSSSGGPESVNLSSATETNTGQKSSATLGLLSSIALGATHGENDSSLDGYTAAVSIGSSSGKRKLHIVAQMATPPGSNASGAAEGIRLFLSDEASPTATSGHEWGWVVNASNNIRGNYRLVGGSTTSITTNLDAAAGAGTQIIDVTIDLDAAGNSAQWTARWKGDDAVVDAQSDAFSNLSSGIWYIGWSAAMLGAPPGAGQTFAGLSITTQWV
jgi:hypothetical protein